MCFFLCVHLGALAQKYDYHVAGRLVLTERLEYGINEINTSGLEKGLYFWAVEAGVRVGDPHERERVKSGKVVKF